MNSYLFYSCDEKILRGSSSGGSFYHFAKTILNRKGVVYGCELINDERGLRAEMVRADSLEKTKKLMKSKYVMSSFDVCSLVSMIGNDLSSNKEVAIVGTPCQLTLIKKKLLENISKEKQERFYTISIICHGVPKNTFFQKYIDELKKKNGKNIKDIDFRYKQNSWSDFKVAVFYSDGTFRVESQNQNPYFDLFLNNYLLLDSCFNCKYKDQASFDFVIGDFWGVEKTDFANEANILGNSIVVAFSDKAIKLMDLISLNTDCFVKQLNGFDFRDYCSKYNTSFLQSVSKPKDYNQIVKLAKRSIHKAHKQLNIKRFFARLKNKVFKKHE